MPVLEDVRLIVLEIALGSAKVNVSSHAIMLVNNIAMITVLGNVIQLVVLVVPMAVRKDVLVVTPPVIVIVEEKVIP